ncbi:MAG TPA: UDP-N-acetylmuramoyl-L-alanine--D-glutamate ligase, partial [Archangium sp.]
MTPDLKDLDVVVFGLAKSGLAAIRLLKARGARVTALDGRTEEALGETA